MEIIQALQAYASPLLDYLVLLLTNLGSEQAYIVMLLVAFVGISPVLGQRLGIALLASFFLNQQAKAFFDTPRPFFEDASIARSNEAIETALGPGFPSGHAQSSTTFWGLAAFYARTLWFWILALILIALISLSRLYLGVHFPIDIIGGVVFGVIIAVASIVIFRELESLEKLPVWLMVALGLFIPLGAHVFFPTADSGLILGVLAAFIVGPLLIAYYPSRQLWKRILLTLVAIVLAFGVLTLSSLLLPEEIKRSVFGSFFRYFIFGLSGTAFVPYLGRLTGLAEQKHLSEVSL